MNRRCWKSLSFAVAATFVFGTFAAAQCDSGSCGTGAYAGGAYSGGSYAGGGFAGGSGSCGCDSGACFSYPGSGNSGGIGGGCKKCGGGCLAQKKQDMKACIDQLKRIQQRDFARNQAWPKPFNCADRQLYFAIWEPMLATGTRGNCLLADNHFDPKTNELNQAGKAKIQGIYKSSPSAQKIALVQNFGNQAVVDARLQNVRSMIDQWYGSQSFVDVAVSSHVPTRFSGARVHGLQTRAADAIPVPAIPVASGTGSTSDVGVGQ